MKRGFPFSLPGLKKRPPKAITEDREQFILSVGRPVVAIVYKTSVAFMGFYHIK